MIGLEPTFEQHIENLVAVFREVRRVLRKDGVCWLNYGDAYASSGVTGVRPGSGRADGKVRNDSPRNRNGTPPIVGLKPKDLMMMPARVAMALQADGWWLRSEIVWQKPNPMPESVTDRPTNSHEKVFLLTKSAKYFYDAEAVRVPCAPDTTSRYERGRSDTHKHADGGPGNQTIAKTFEHMRKTDKQRGHSRRHDGFNDRWDAMSKDEQQSNGANLRNVWTIATQGVSAAHFATFPEKLVEPCILAGTSAEGACAKCGAPWERVVEKNLKRRPDAAYKAPPVYVNSDENDQGNNRARDGHKPGHFYEVNTTGWEPTCDCEAAKVPCTVLDPFVGSGTTLRVATRLNRRGIGCDLTYQDIAKKRTSRVQRVLPLG